MVSEVQILSSPPIHFIFYLKNRRNILCDISVRSRSLMKKIFLFSFAIVFLAGCGNNDTIRTDSYSAKNAEAPVITPIVPPVAPVQFPDVKINSTTPSMTTSTPVQKTYVATLHTDEGDIEITLNTNQTPKTVENFVTLAKKDFYDNTIFHRTLKGFMIQGGDPKGDGTGNPGYKFDDETFTGEYTRGTVAMANSGPNTNGSQFFIMHADYALRPNYVIFGHVTKGLDVVDKIATAPVELNGREMSKPVTPVKINSVTVIEK